MSFVAATLGLNNSMLIVSAISAGAVIAATLSYIVKRYARSTRTQNDSILPMTVRSNSLGSDYSLDPNNALTYMHGGPKNLIDEYDKEHCFTISHSPRKS
jgi:hypothetical protein